MTYYQTAHGKINAIIFTSQKPTGSTILCIHGFPYDARIFAYAGTRLSQEGHNVVCIDLPGHGGSEGPRGDLDFKKCMESIHQIVEDLKKHTRVYMLAHSMGSTFALWYAHTYKNSLDGLIVLCPYVRIPNIKRSDAEPTASTFLYLLLRRILTPRKRVDIRKVLPRYGEVSGEEFATAARDPLMNLKYSYRYLVDVIAMRNSKVKQLVDIVDPILLLHGQKDRNVFVQVSKEYFKLVRSTEKQLKIFDCDHWFYDAMFYEQDTRYPEESRDAVISSICEWIESHKPAILH